jgi:hypothetical protein
VSEDSQVRFEELLLLAYDIAWFGEPRTRSLVLERYDPMAGVIATEPYERAPAVLRKSIPGGLRAAYTRSR